tara:strand:+ start:112 stop:501 length:390 start_codon:yes stop_codon:yes gene_type:complete
MGQRVNIQYSVELDELQDEVTRLFNNAIEVLELNSVKPRPDKHTIDLGTSGLEQLERLRLRLSRVDIMLGDIQNIVEGYIRFKTQPEPAREIPFQQTSEELEVEQLQDKISKFKELLNENANQESSIQN